MLNTITIDINTYDYLQKQVQKGYTYNQNSRKVQNSDDNINRYQVYKHYDTSDKRFCQSKSVLTSFGQNGVLDKLSLNRKIDFQKAINELESRKSQYMSLYRRLEQKQSLVELE